MPAPLTSARARMPPLHLVAGAVAVVAGALAVLRGDGATLALLMVAGAALALSRLRAAVLLWIALSCVVNAPLYSRRTAAVHFSAAFLCVLLGVWIGGMGWRRTWRLAPSSLALPLCTLAAAAVASSVLANLFYDPDVPGTYWFLAVQVYATALAVLSAGAALLVGNTLDSAAALRRLYWIIVGLGALVLASPFLPIRLFIGEPGWWPLLVAHAAALVYARMLRDPAAGWWQRILGVAFIAYAAERMVVEQLLNPGQGQWLSGWIALGVPLAVITLLRLRPAYSVPIVAAGGAALVFVVAPLLPSLLENTHREGGFLRLQLWRDAFRLASLRPFLGVGPGNYADYMETYGREWVIMTSAHGDYQQVAAEMGFAGLAALLWVLATALATGWRLSRFAATPFLRALALGITGTVCGQALCAVVGDYLIPAYHNKGHFTFCITVYTWVLLGALMAIERVGGRTDADGATVPSPPPSPASDAGEGVGPGWAQCQ